MLQESDPYYIVLGGSKPGITRAIPTLSEQDDTTVVVKVENLRVAERLQGYESYFTGDVRQVAQAIAAAADYQDVFYPVAVGTINGVRVRMIFSDHRDIATLMQTPLRRKYQRVDSFLDAVKYMLAAGDRNLITEYGVAPWPLPVKLEAISTPPQTRDMRSISHAPGMAVPDVSSASTATGTGTARKKPNCTVCQRPMKGHNKLECNRRLQQSLDSPSSENSKPSQEIRPNKVAGQSPLAVPSAEVEDLVKLAQNLNISPTPPGSVDAPASEIVTKGGGRPPSSRALGTIAHSAVMMAVGAGIAFTYLSL
ncbi:hypothetical protein DXG01_010507 [Tephrocybe rancida]|nr:hypothetical protein DXG01_010507 [Tephrocybe rancida]